MGIKADPVNYFRALTLHSRARRANFFWSRASDFHKSDMEIMKADCFSETFYSLFQVLENENCFSLEIMLRIKGLPVF